MVMWGEVVEKLMMMWGQGEDDTKGREDLNTTYIYSISCLRLELFLKIKHLDSFVDFFV